MAHLLQNRLYLQGLQLVPCFHARLDDLGLLVLRAVQIHPSFLGDLVDQALQLDPDKKCGGVVQKIYRCLQSITQKTFDLFLNDLINSQDLGV